MIRVEELSKRTNGRRLSAGRTAVAARL